MAEVIDVTSTVGRLLAQKATLANGHQVAARVAALSAQYVVEHAIDLDGTVNPFDRDPQKSAPVESAVSGINALRAKTPYVEPVTGRDGLYLADKLPEWGWAGLRARPLYGSQTLTWDAQGEPQLLASSPEALEGCRRISMAEPVITQFIERSGFALSPESQPGSVYARVKGHMFEFQMAELAPDRRAAFEKFFNTNDAFKRYLKANDFKLKWHDSGSVEITTIAANKLDIATKENIVPWGAGLDDPTHYVFFCDETGDEELAESIRINDRGLVIVTYNAPSEFGKGTPLKLLRLADFIAVSGEIAHELGVTGIDRDALAQDRMGDFMQEVALGLDRTQICTQATPMPAFQALSGMGR